LEELEQVGLFGGRAHHLKPLVLYREQHYSSGVDVQHLYAVPGERYQVLLDAEVSDQYVG